MIQDFYQSEVTDINKQKFLAELGKLLTFMYEEDRLRALSMYSDIFDMAEDEQALLNLLISPTRQAVIIARAYNARERKLQIHSQSKDAECTADEDGEAPAFVQAIAELIPYVACRETEPEVDENQLSLFEDIENPCGDSEPQEEVQQQEVQQEEPEQETQEPEEQVTQELCREKEPEEAPAESEEAQAEPEETEAADESDGAALPEEPELYDNEAVLPMEDIEAGEPEEIEEPSGEAPVYEDTQDEENLTYSYPPEEPCETEGVFETYSPVPVGTVRKPRVFLMILYIIAAAPVTAAGIVLLLIPTLLCLALAVGTVAGGIMLLASPFKPYQIFANKMVVIGAAIILFALGLFFMWAFIWFIGSAMAALVRGVLDLGRKWCYKEVPAE